METNLRAFMKEELKGNENIEFPGIDKFTDSEGKPIPFIIKRLTKKEIKEIRERYRTKRVYRDKENGNRPVIENGQVAMIKDYDPERAGLHIMVAAFVQPKLNDPQLMEYYGALDMLDMPEIIFSERAEFSYANKCVLEACGLASKENDSKVVEKIKN